MQLQTFQMTSRDINPIKNKTINGKMLALVLYKMNGGLYERKV